MNDNNNKKKKSSNKKLLILLCILVLSASVFGGTYGLSHADLLNEKEVTTDSVYVDLGKITVNLADKNENRYFMGQIYVGYNKGDRKSAQELTKDKKLVIVRDVINFYFKSKDVQFINNINNITQIKEELINSINENLKDCKITDIRFNGFIIQ